MTARPADGPATVSSPLDVERAARGVAALRELRRNGASGPTGQARPGAGLERSEILRGRALTGLMIAPASDAATQLAAGLGALGALDEAYRSFAIASIDAGLRALAQGLPAEDPTERSACDEARLVYDARPGDTITTVLLVANRSYRAVSASPRATRWYEIESGSPVDDFEVLFEGEPRFEPRGDALWRLSIRTPARVDRPGTYLAAISFGPELVPSIRMEVHLAAARRRTGPGPPSPS